eukprot:19195_1
MRFCETLLGYSLFLFQWNQCSHIHSGFQSSTSTTSNPTHVQCKSVELSIGDDSHLIPTDACFNTMGVLTAEPQSGKFVCDDHGEAHLLIFEDSLDCVGIPASPKDPCSMHGKGCSSIGHCDKDPCNYVYLERGGGLTMDQCNGRETASSPDVYTEYYSLFRPPLTSYCEDDYNGVGKVTSYCETGMV